MKKALSGVLVGLVFAGSMPIAAFAETTTNQQNLLNQINSLNTQIGSLQKQADDLTAQLYLQMQVGSNGDQVQILQGLLASDPDIYPEGLITGYYGPATERAVKRFQKKYGIDMVGRVGPKSLKKFNELLKDRPLAFENHNGTSTNGGPKFVLCAAVPPGHLVAPGWNRKRKDGRDVIKYCQKLPDRYWKKFHGTSTTDTVAPQVSRVIVTGVKNNSATIFWYTNEPSDSQIAYGTTNSYGSNTNLEGAFTNVHTQSITGLSADTTYHFQVRSKDPAGNVGTSENMTFKTKGGSNSGDTTAPTISSISVSNITPTSVTINWLTNENANGQISYGTTAGYGSTTTLDGSLVANHSQTITGLSTSTLYHFQIRSRDNAGNLGLSSDVTFTTAANPPSDVSAPTLSSIVVSAITQTSATISWVTNENADTQIVYGATAGYGSTTTLDGSLVTVHSQNISGLTASTTYHFQARSKDGSANLGSSVDLTFTTLPVPADVTAPTISGISATVGSTTATVNWTTNESSNSKVYYGTANPLVLGSASAVSDSALVLSHSRNLLGLSASTTYYYVVESADSSGNTSTSSQQTFTTGN